MNETKPKGELDDIRNFLIAFHAYKWYRQDN